MRQALQNGEIGKLEMMHITSRHPAAPLSYVKVSGGQLPDQTIHFLICCAGWRAKIQWKVYGNRCGFDDPAIGEAGDVDTSMVILKFASGALCHIDCSRRADYGYDERVEVFGSKGMALSERKPRREVTLYQGEKIISDGLHPGWFERMEPTFYEALGAFIKAVQGEKTEYPTLWDGLMAQVIAEAAVNSLKTNQPVKITYESAEKMGQ